MRFYSFFVVFVSLLMPFAASALQSETARAEFSASTLVVGERQDNVLHAAVKITLKDGWKTYWRSPGDAGFPFLAEAAESATNIKQVEVQWPYPQRFVEEWELEVFGFKHELTLPLKITLADAASPTQADLAISYAVCSDICINEEQSLSLSVPADFAQDGDLALVQKAQANVPATNGEHSLTIGEAVIDTETDEGGVLAVRVEAAGGIRKADLFIESDAAGLRFPKAELVLDEGGKTGAFLVPYELSLPAKTLGGEEIRLTFVNNNQAVDTTLTLTKPGKQAAISANSDGAGGGEAAQPSNDVNAAEGNNAADAPMPEAEEMALLPMLLLALLGGLVLNIMPCVLPVLSIKMLGAVKHGGRNNREVRQSFLASVAGILVFFAGLALLTIAAKNAGHAVGWGFHFQSPGFLTFLTVLVVLFAMNLLGWFEIRLPDALNTHIYDVTDTGAMRHRHHLLGDFFTGAFAALMATPCTAPFLGTAVGFALARGSAEIFAIFLALGFGLAVPYLAAALVPALATKLPKPGAWMLRVKQVMGVLMLAAAIWLLWVIAGQTSVAVAVGILLLSALLGAVLHGGGRWRFLRRSSAVAAIALTLLVSLAVLPSMSITPQQDAEPPMLTEAASQWRSFDRSEIPTLVSQGKVVFVDVTADWCLTCKYNKLRALDREAVQAALGAEHVVAMRADMTRPMPAIQDYLREYGRFGIPFNIVYGPAAPEGKPLPELLTPELVLEALESAR